MVKYHEVLWSSLNIVASHKFTWQAGKLDRIASKEIIPELLKAKCLPDLYYGLEARPVNKSEIRPLEYLLNNRAYL